MKDGNQKTKKRNQSTMKKKRKYTSKLSNFQFTFYFTDFIQIQLYFQALALVEEKWENDEERVKVQNVLVLS